MGSGLERAMGSGLVLRGPWGQVLYYDVSFVALGVATGITHQTITFS
jgi:hypothetical protein